MSLIAASKKRKWTPKVYDFHTFADAGYPSNLKGAFRDNIRLFLKECAEPHETNVRSMPTWCTLLGQGSSTDVVVPLYTIVEDVRSTQRPYCDHCRCAGWGNHFVSKRNYHLIIPAADEWNKPLADDFVDLHTHLLHGLLHCNGFGHLLCINGIAGGSKYLCGRQLMDLWDRICTSLRIRKITVQDFSRKRSMDLRLLYGVGYGHSWYGKWGYQFCRGSFGVAELDYYRAMKDLCSLDLDQIVKDFSDADKCREINQLIHHYRDMSETQLMTLNDLLGFMLTIRSHAPVRINKATAALSSSTSKPSTGIFLQNKPFVKGISMGDRSLKSVIADMEDGNRPAKRLEYAAEVIVNALKENDAGKFCHGKMTRQDLKDAARVKIGDTGLLDYVLKSLDNVIVGTHVVCRTKNPTTRTFEYSLHELGYGIKSSEPDTEVLPKPFSAPALLPGVDVYCDLVYLYRNILVDYSGSDWVNKATRALLNSKYFVKEWPLIDQKDQFLTFTCRLMPNLGDIETELRKGFPPGEVVVVPMHATVGELKQAVENAVRDTYCIAENFLVMEIEELEGLKDEAILFGAVASGICLGVVGIGLALQNPLRCQAGVESWTVRCICGTEDDDGERMVACNICDVWQHTYCCGIEDSEAIPLLYLCRECELSIPLGALSENM